MGLTHRGEIWKADLGVPRGSGPGGRRPVLIIQSDAYNSSALRTTIVAVFTSNQLLGAVPGNVAMPAERTGLDRDSVLNVSSVLTVDESALLELLGSVDNGLLDQVDAGLRRVLDLRS